VASPALRAVADIIGQVVSLLIGTLTDAETNAQQLAREGMLTALAEALARPVSLQDALSAAQADLLGLVKAAGAIVRLSGATSFVGVTPADAERLLDMLMARCDGELLAIDDLGLRHSSFAHCASRASGALLLPIAPGREATGDAILWFRPEIVETVTWGGDPAEHSKQDLNTQQLSPRASFTAWKQIVAGRCMPWTAVDEAMARRLCGAVEASMAQRTKAELARLRHYDVLTGLPNRSLLQDRLTEIGHGPGPGAALLFLDLDRFKAVNDTLGHAAGDMLLVEVAHRLLAEAGPPQLTARLGGDEFVVLCRGLEPDGVTQLAERIRASVEAPYEIAGRTCHIAASIGIALAGKLGGLDLVRAADMAMYAAKQGGGNRGVLFEPALFDHATQQLDLENGLRQALAGRDELVLLYQPIFAIAAGTRSLAGFEALVRWRHPRHGWMSPAQFMPVAEKSGLILPLGEWVLATAAHQARVFQLIQAGGSLSMAVNISALQLSQPGFCAGLSGLLEAEGLPPAALCLEFTESILSDAADTATLAGIRALGARVAIDDFGMGHSALSYLRELPADAVKLDRSFLECADGSLENPAFVGAVTALIRAAGKSVVFEGIETQKQFDIVLAAGADMAQGFFLAPPLSANAAHGLVDQYKEAERRRNIRMPNK
jgi:diguanylate cyclase (GGDEF)-like protein